MVGRRSYISFFLFYYWFLVHNLQDPLISLYIDHLSSNLNNQADIEEACTLLYKIP